jgi:hypothetical protein
LPDDLVFPAGTMHLVSTNLDATFSMNDRLCTFTVNVLQTGVITGGTGRFAAATGSSTAVVVARGLLARNADGTCSQERAPVAEVDTISSNGTLSF